VKTAGGKRPGEEARFSVAAVGEKIAESLIT
jgi:hypothetical protein